MKPIASVSKYLRDLGAARAGIRPTEQSYRTPLETLLRDLLAPAADITQESGNILGVGTPDYILSATLHGATNVLGCVETKNIGDQDLHGAAHNQDQFNRYKTHYNNCVFTDYLRFVFYQNKQLVDEIAIAELSPQGEITSLPDSHHRRFIALLESAFIGQELRIQTADDLVAAMADRTRLLADAIASAMAQPHTQAGSAFNHTLQFFQARLLKTLTPEKFASMAAQTIAYGFLIARAKLPEGEHFTRQRACELIPASIHFLRGFFNHIAGADIPPAIKWIADSMTNVFAAADIHAILHRHGQQTGAQDPAFHFYESFLAEYAPQERAQRGVWYTPEPVVNFIVGAVDDILQTQFKLPQGLATRDTTTIDVVPERKYSDKEAPKPVPTTFHKVQILDPGAGTGSFLSEVIRRIHAKVAGGGWSDYVEQHLLPRVNGFEILMAPYAMAHFQLAELLKSLGYVPRQDPPPRCQIYFTDALERPDAEAPLVMMQWLQRETEDANLIKRYAPVLCVLGNPPYLATSANTGEWITDLMGDYKMEPGGKTHLQENTYNALNDDYVKFIRYAQRFIQKGQRGIVAYINPHGYLDAPTFRGMRWQLQNTFDRIYVIDLHGNARRKQPPNGVKDENVFNIMQGVSINLFVKTGEKPDGALARVFHHDLYGERDHKYDFLRNRSLSDVPFTELQPQAPMFYMVPRDYQLQGDYERGISIAELFMKKSVGVITSRDRFCIQFSKNAMQQTIAEFLSLSEDAAREKFSLGKNPSNNPVASIRRDLTSNYPDNGSLCEIAYRPFDGRWTFYTGNAGGFHYRPIVDMMQHFMHGDNIALVACRQTKSSPAFSHVFVTNRIMDRCLMSNRSGEENYVFPLYLHTAPDQLGAPAAARTPNLNMTIVGQIATCLGLQFSEQESDSALTPENLLDYIYATLHSPAYRAKYREFLKTDFPRIPCPANKAEFRRLASIGQQLRQTHLLQHPATQTPAVTYPKSGDHHVTTVKYQDGKVYINRTQHFANVPAAAWTHRIGGYQPAQKYLKDRRNQTLTYDDIEHYPQIIAALTHTQTLINTIDT